MKYDSADMAEQIAEDWWHYVDYYREFQHLAFQENSIQPLDGYFTFPDGVELSIAELERSLLTYEEDVKEKPVKMPYDRHDAVLVAQAFQNLPKNGWVLDCEDIDNIDIKEQ